jgi:murein DD-endopeptidase MepM/ murein hydrolase activator NlpD
VALTKLSESGNPVNYTAIRPDINWLVRLNWGYGSTGTIPLPQDDAKYVAALRQFVAGSRGVHTYIVGNEPNHEQERPNNQIITPSRYIDFYEMVRGVIKNINPLAWVAVAPCAPYHASPTSWLDYQSQLWKGAVTDAIILHTYLRSSDPDDVNDDSLRMGDGVLKGTQAGFLSYRDALQLVPGRLKNHPVYITECCELLPMGWDNRNTGVIKAVYREIRSWNKLADRPKIAALCLYRYPNYDHYGLVDKQNVLQDFKEAISESSVEPQEGQENVFIPQVVQSSREGGNVASTLDLEPSLKARGVRIQPPSKTDGVFVWKVVKAHWLNKEESQGRHHFYFDVLDEKGNRLVDVPILITWPSGVFTITTEAKPGEPYSANYPMSSSRNDYSAVVADGNPSETVTGVGMGADLGAGFNASEHTSTFVVFQKVENTVKTPTKPTNPLPKSGLYNLYPPLGDYVNPPITQRFGQNLEEYKPLLGHTGVDFAVPTGTKVFATDEGTALEVREDVGGYGNYIKLVHPWGESLYAHLSYHLVGQGQRVQRGEWIGLTGSTGNSTGPHLHFAIRVNPYDRTDGYDGFADPLRYLSSAAKPVTIPAPGVVYGYSEIVQVIKQVAEESNLDWELLASLAWAESSFRPQIHDGLFQVGDDVWSDWASVVKATERNNPLDNARVAAAYLNWLFEKTNGDIEKSLIAYNWGLSRVLAGGEPPELTRLYMRKIIHGWDLLKAVTKGK